MLFQGPLLRTSSALNSELERLGQGVVIAVAGAADRCDGAGLGESLGVAHCDVLDSLVRVVNQPADVPAGAASGPQALLKGVESQVGAQRAGQLPAEHPPGVDVDDERGVDPAGEGAAVGDVGDPQLVRAGRGEGAFDQVRAQVRTRSRDRGARAFRPAQAARPGRAHQQLQRAPGSPTLPHHWHHRPCSRHSHPTADRRGEDYIHHSAGRHRPSARTPGTPRRRGRPASPPPTINRASVSRWRGVSASLAWDTRTSGFVQWSPSAAPLHVRRSSFHKTDRSDLVVTRPRPTSPVSTGSRAGVIAWCQLRPGLVPHSRAAVPRPARPRARNADGLPRR
jgi:hypothetical protein